jgi:hypothetical protein
MASVPAIPVIVLILVFVGIAIRKVGRFTFKIWHIMLIGAMAVLVTGQIAPLSALRAINPEVMIFLQAHGVSSAFAAKIFKHYGNRSIEVVRENPFRLATDIFGLPLNFTWPV